jgi:hypothetical protein
MVNYMKIQGITYKGNDEELFRELTESLNEIFLLFELINKYLKMSD